MVMVEKKNAIILDFFFIQLDIYFRLMHLTGTFF